MSKLESWVKCMLSFLAFKVDWQSSVMLPLEILSQPTNTCFLMLERGIFNFCFFNRSFQTCKNRSLLNTYVLFSYQIFANSVFCLLPLFLFSILKCLYKFCLQRYQNSFSSLPKNISERVNSGSPQSCINWGSKKSSYVGLRY